MSGVDEPSAFDLNRQNDRRALIYRAGADHYFRLVGLARRAELLVVTISVVIGLVAASVPSVQFDYAFWGLVLAAVDASLVYAAIGAYRHAAAEMSDCFDRYLFSTPMTAAACAPCMDTVTAFAERALAKRSDQERLSNWYDSRLAALPRTAAHLAGLRINAFWDTSLRGLYIVIVCSIAALVAIAGAYLFSRHGFSLERLVTNVLVPFAPAILWFLRELVDQLDARRRKLEFQRQVESAYRRLHQGSPGAEATAGEEADYLQSVLFAYRRSDVSVPGWLYDLTRDRLHGDVSRLMDRILDGTT
jgi:hypothetical protein